MKIKYEEYKDLEDSVVYQLGNEPSEIAMAILLLCKIALTFIEIDPETGPNE